MSDVGYGHGSASDTTQSFSLATFGSFRSHRRSASEISSHVITFNKLGYENKNGMIIILVRKHNISETFEAN